MTALIVQVRALALQNVDDIAGYVLTTYTSPENLNVSTHNFISTFSSTVGMPSHTELHEHVLCYCQ